MAKQQASEDIFFDTLYFAVEMLWAAVKGVLYVLFVGAFKFWGYVTRRLGFYIPFYIAFLMLSCFALAMAYWHAMPYTIVDSYVSAKAYHGLARPGIYFLMAWVFVNPLYIFFHLLRNRGDANEAWRSLVIGRCQKSKRPVMIATTTVM